MEWELTKENCVPVRQGRSKAALCELADPVADALEAKRRELWAEVSDYKGDDPLEAWQKYIKWMQEYGVGGGKADLMKVLEACTKELQKYPRYTNDIRFLRIWIQYADCLPDPDDVFLFLKEMGIGRDFALYYEAYATYFELKGNFQDADAVYMDGIQRGVKQLERLKQKHAAFQQRMAQRVQRRIQDEQVMGPPPPEPMRANLAAIGSRGAGRGHVGQQQQSAGGMFGVAAAPQQSAGLFGLRPGTAQQARGQQSIFGLHEDDEFARGENPRIVLPGYSSMPQANNVRELQPYRVRRKENLDRALAWNQASLLPCVAPTSAGASASGIEIFTDEEFQDGSDDLPARAASTGKLQRGGLSAAAGQSAASQLLLPGADRSEGMDALMLSLAPPPRTLLRGLPTGPTHSVSESIAALSAPAAAAATSVAALAQQQPFSARGSMATPAAALGQLARHPDDAAGGRSGHAPRPGELPVSAQRLAMTAADAGCRRDGTDGLEEELSYEELRALAWFRRNPAPGHQSCAAAEAFRVSGLCDGAFATRSGVQLAPQEPLRTSQGHLRDALPRQQPQTAQHAGIHHAASRCASEAENAVRIGAAGPSGRGEPAAEAAAMRCVLGQVLPAAGAAMAGAPAQQPLSGGRTGASGNDAEIVNWNQPRALADAAPVARVPQGQSALPVGPGFPAVQQVLRPDQPRASGLPATTSDSDRSHDDAQPTVTISTRGAFDLMNSFFSDDLPHQKARSDRGRAVATAAPLPPTEAARAPWPQPAAAQPTPVSAPPQVPAAEPTVTLHTKLAFDALNDMFCDTLPHEEARKVARRTGAPSGVGGGGGGGGLTGHIKPITCADVCRLVNAGRSGAAAAPASRRDPPCGSRGGGEPFSGAADTTLVAAHGLTVAASGLAIHEDTFFLGPAPAAVPGCVAEGYMAGGSRLAPPAHNPVGQPEVAALYEDTDLISRGGGGGGGSTAASSGAFILEDTEFMTRHHSSNVAAPGYGGYDSRGGRVQAGAGATAACMSSGPGARDFTTVQAVGRNSTANLQQRSGIPSKGSSIQIYEDTQYNLDD